MLYLTYYFYVGRNLADLEQTKQEVLILREARQLKTICDLVVADLSLVAQLPVILKSCCCF